jgi:rhodanese-related sulfurtransferase
MMKQLSPQEFSQWMTEHKEYYLVDVREKWEYDLVHLDNSILAPLGSLQSRPPEIDKEKAVVVICHHGRRSIMGCHILEAIGFTDLYNLTGGINSYADTVDPTMTKY